MASHSMKSLQNYALADEYQSFGDGTTNPEEPEGIMRAIMRDATREI